MAVISVRNLVKEFKVLEKEPGLMGTWKSFVSPKYKHVLAVDNISLEIKKGESVAFIGPNGAGKSTTLKMLTGILYATSGEMNVLGLSPSRKRKRLAYKLGTVFGQKSQLWYHLPPQETYDLFSKIYDLNEKEYRSRLKKLIKVFEVEEFLQTPVRKLSLGQRMRCELVAALLHDPELLLLDEPTIGLDLLSKKSLRNTIKQLNSEGITVLLTSHDLDDIEHVCERVVVINHGKIIYDDSLQKLKQTYVTKKRIEVILDKNSQEPIKGKGITVLAADGFRVQYEIDLSRLNAKEFVGLLLKHYAKAGVADINIADPTVEELIEGIYRG